MKRSMAAFWLKLLLLGGVSFWMPDAIVHMMARDSFSGIHVLALTILLPVCFGGAYVIVHRRLSGVSFVWLPMLVGLWTLGGVFMAIGASFAGGGFASQTAGRETFLVMLLSILPPYTFIMATYDGSLFALLLATIITACLGLVLNRKPLASPH